MSIRARGTVRPARQVVLQPEVSGRVVWQNDALVPGGYLEKNALLVRIDARDFQLSLESSEANVAKARLDYKLERSRKEVAEREWKLFGGDAPTADDDPDGGTLALREPQVKTARVAVQSAESARERAQLNLSRTRVQAPFNALVMEESVDVGQLVSPQSRLATLVGTDQFWVQVSVPVEALPWIDVPAPDKKTKGSPARVIQDVGKRRIEREGHVVRLLPDLDPSGTMARLLVAVDDPLALDAPDGAEKRRAPGRRPRLRAHR